VPRYPPLDLGPIALRIVERQSYAVGRDMPAVEADTEMMVDMLRAIRNLRLANEILKEVIHVNFGRTNRHG
jgi:hypothetical protein